jgi:hypothetical protein
MPHIDLVGLREVQHDPGRRPKLAHEGATILVRQVGDLDEARAPRDEDQPGKSGIVHQQHG